MIEDQLAAAGLECGQIRIDCIDDGSDFFVNDLVMPVVGAVTGGLDFSNFFLPLSSNVTANSLAAARAQGAVLAYGNFITVAVNFVIIAFVLFLIVRAINAARAGASHALSRYRRPISAGRDDSSAG